MFKHEESPEGALNAEQVLQKALRLKRRAIYAPIFPACLVTSAGIICSMPSARRTVA